jgi:hypothetical protein
MHPDACLGLSAQVKVLPLRVRKRGAILQHNAVRENISRSHISLLVFSDGFGVPA